MGKSLIDILLDKYIFTPEWQGKRGGVPARVGLG